MEYPVSIPYVASYCPGMFSVRVPFVGWLGIHWDNPTHFYHVSVDGRKIKALWL